jgi:intracellular septation protein
MQLIKLGLEFGPLAVFFIANYLYDLQVATAALMVATVFSLVASRILLKKIPVMPLITGAVVLVFGGLTLLLKDDTFIKMKPTIVNAIMASVLIGGLLFKRPLIKIVLGEVLQLQDEGWRKLTARWAGFFVFLAILNEIVWRNFSSDFWVTFKTFGVMPLTMLFMLAQIGLIEKYQISDNVSDSSSS